MKINNIAIDNINGIKHLELSFNTGLNLICGENGVGKTTILKAIAHNFLHGEDSSIKKHYGSEKGTVSMGLIDCDLDFSHYEINDFIPGYIPKYNIFDGKKEISDSLLYFLSEHSFDYVRIDSLPSMNRNINDIRWSSQQLLLGVDKDIKSWFINRYLFSKSEGSLDEYQIFNLDLSKRIFSILDNSLCIDTVKPDYEIVLNSGNDKLFFEMLSDGYKSCVFILLGIIKEVEFRYPNIKATDFSGVIMIDEIDIHLHPQWQAKLVKVLKEIFPKAQIIATTHSPSILQNAKKEEIIPLYRDEEGNTHIKELSLGEYGLQGWTLEEILQDVMGMPSTTSDLYLETIHHFDHALNNEDKDEILKYYNILKKMLHPNNPLLQLLEIQVAEWKD